MNIEQEIDKVRHELFVVIPEEMKSVINSGDLRENTEFSEILSRQEVLASRLKQLTNRLNACTQIDVNNIPRDEVGIGSMVTILHTDPVHGFTISSIVKLIPHEISDDEPDGYMEVTLNSNIGKAILGKKIGDTFTLYLPPPSRTYTITHIVTIHDQ